MSTSESKELYESVIQQLFDLFAIPEIRRRQTDKLLPDPFELKAFQIVFFADDRKPEIRLNSEVKAKVEIKLKDGVSKQPGEIIYDSEVEGIEEFSLTEAEDPDIGHATIIRTGEKVFLAFDFIYNKGLSATHIAKGDQFLRTAESAYKNQDASAFIDNLFSAAELYARAILLTASASPQFREKSNHKSIHSKLNRFASLGNLDKNQVSTFNKLSHWRNQARYLSANPSINDNQANELIMEVKRMADSARMWARLKSDNTTPTNMT
jgi:hypothetical protein